MLNITELIRNTGRLFAFYPKYAPEGDQKAQNVYYDDFLRSLRKINANDMEIKEAVDFIIDNGTPDFFDGNMLALIRKLIMKNRFPETASSALEALKEMDNKFKHLHIRIGCDQSAKAYKEAKEWLTKNSPIAAHILYDVIKFDNYYGNNASIMQSLFIKLFNEAKEKALSTGNYKQQFMQLQKPETEEIKLLEQVA